METVDTIVIGAGVVGLAVAAELAVRGRTPLVLESEAGFGTGISSRNSEVIHAGIYYPAGSLKARLCVDGRERLYRYCETHGVAHRRCGKLIVATSKRYGVDPTLMLALSYQESGWNMRAVSPANAIGAMQVIPASGEWASALIGRDLNLLDPADNVEAGVVLMSTLLASTDTRGDAIGSYYQGLASVREHGLFSDTQQYVRNITHFMTTL